MTDDNKKVVIGIAFLSASLLCGCTFAKYYQPHKKTIRIYKQALKDYENQNYSNAYYLFSKIGNLSALKPIAIYRQALCAKALGDKKSEFKMYKDLFKKYPKNPLSLEAKYRAGQIIIYDRPDIAIKYFKNVAQKSPQEDYKYASDYYIAEIKRTSKLKSGYSKKEYKEIEAAFKNYLEKFPEGVLAGNVASSWSKFEQNPKEEDKLLIARGLYSAKKYADSLKILKDTSVDNNWAIQAMNLHAQKKYTQARDLVNEGIKKDSAIITVQDYNHAIDDYISLIPDTQKYEILSDMYQTAQGSKKDYIGNLRCQYTNNENKYQCYKDFYKTFPNSDYAQTALFQMLQENVKTRNYGNYMLYAKDYINKYKDSDNMPFVMFWIGKCEEKNSNTNIAENYYRQILELYPDSYYAYRSYWKLKHVNSSTIKTPLEYKPVQFPYKTPDKNGLLANLTEVADFNMLSKYMDDSFLKSWGEYQKGNYANSMITARDAMDKLKVKPPKSDLRWRLVYPQNYFKQVENSAHLYKNNPALMMAIIREESSFNTESQSSVGAIGLMQLMPTTAHDIGAKNNISFNTSYLFNPELNIKLGNLYYSDIKKIANNNDIYAIAAYNGGIGAVAKWSNDLKFSDIDEFVEQIPYDETRNYVKKVFRSYWNYTRIYQK